MDINSILDIKFKNKNTIIYSNNNQEIIQKNLINNEIKSLSIRKYPEQLEFCKNNKFLHAKDLMNTLYNNGYSVIDILFYFFIYIKNYSKFNLFKLNCFQFL